MRVFIQNIQQRVKPTASSNPFAIVLGWLLFGVMLAVGLVVGLLFLLLSWLLLLPVLWRKRREIKQMWAFGKAARQSQKQAQQQYQKQQSQRQNQQDPDVIEGEYEVKNDRR